MRKYDNIIKDYLNWYSIKTKDKQYLPDNYLTGDEASITVKKAAIWESILELCYKKTDGIYWFKKFILGNMVYAGYPEPIDFNKLWLKWTKIKGDHLAIKCSRQHGKSTFWTVIQTLYRIALFEHYNVLISSASEDQAMMLMGFIVKLINNNEFLAAKKAKSGRWSTTEINYNGGKVVAKGVGSEVRGGTYDFIVCDDILRSDNKLSDAEIENYIDEELEPMIFVRKGQIVIVGTPKSDTDIFTTIEGRIKDGSLWKLFIFPAITNVEEQELLCPERFTWKELEAKRSIMGQIKFDKEFMCKTYSSGSQLFPYQLRKQARELGKSWKLYSKAKMEDLQLWQYYIGVDVARAGTASADYTVATVIAYNVKTQEKRVVWIWRKKGLKIAHQVRQIASLSKRFNHPTILVEKNNIGQDFIDVMIDDYNLNVESYTTGAKGQLKQDLIRYLMIAFENEKMILPSENQFSREIIQDLDDELDRFVVEITKTGNEVMKGSGHSHDDMVISLALANRCSQSFGYTPFAKSEPRRTTTELERFKKTRDVGEVLKYNW